MLCMTKFSKVNAPVYLLCKATIIHKVFFFLEMLAEAQYDHSMREIVTK